MYGLSQVSRSKTLFLGAWTKPKHLPMASEKLRIFAAATVLLNGQENNQPMSSLVLGALSEKGRRTNARAGIYLLKTYWHVHVNSVKVAMHNGAQKTVALFAV
jgi:hypothetical protein